MPPLVSLPPLGLIVPDDGPLDYELYRLDGWLRERGVEVRIEIEDSPTPGVPVGADDRDLEQVLHRTGAFEVIGPLARRLGERGCEVIVWACTSGSFIGGYEWSLRQAEHLALESGRTCTSTTLALIEAARALAPDGVDVLSTYPGAGTQWLVRTLREAGVRVVDIVAHACDAPHLHERYATYVIELDVAALIEGFITSLPPSTRPVLVPNTSINTLDLVADLERRTGRTLITANQASIWQALRALGVGRVERAGKLLEGGRS